MVSYGEAVHFKRNDVILSEAKDLSLHWTMTRTSMNSKFPPFSLSRLLQTVFRPKPGETVAILIDLADPKQVRDFAFLKDPQWSVQKYAHDIFYQGLKRGVAKELGITQVDFFAYKITGGSNRNLPDVAFAPDGREISLKREVYPRYTLVLCISNFSATAPLTAFAHQYGFRGATLHGLNEIILSTGLSVDYNEVSRTAEKLRLGMTKADWVEIDFKHADKVHTLKLHLAKQEAQKSHGICRDEPDVANLPAGEIYYVPTGAEGRFPMKYEDGTIGLMEVSNGRIQAVSLLQGRKSTIEEHQAKLKSDPVTGELGELGFGTQVLPFSGRDIQDEKILGTLHVATGRSDHLGGSLTPDKFAKADEATHDDILFAPHKTPEIDVPQVRMMRNGKMEVLIERYQPAAYMKHLLGS